MTNVTAISLHFVVGGNKKGRGSMENCTTVRGTGVMLLLWGSVSFALILPFPFPWNRRIKNAHILRQLLGNLWKIYTILDTVIIHWFVLVDRCSRLIAWQRIVCIWISRKGVKVEFVQFRFNARENTWTLFEVIFKKNNNMKAMQKFFNNWNFFNYAFGINAWKNFVTPYLSKVSQ